MTTSSCFCVSSVSPRLAALFGTLVFRCLLHGQTAPAVTRPAEEYSKNVPDDTVVLSPFIVATERDTGFAAASALAGGRLALDL